ncbi:MAG: hypothetical protein EHM79_19255 [Geobacter sp.]|nr:MAG: hypothetical protein EHM79_19255 [Geobacter sp.]
MQKTTKIFWRFMFLLVICSFIMVVSLMTPIPKEPENLSSETWSYYSGRSPPEVFVILHRNEILAVLFVIILVPDIVLLMYEFWKQKKR